VFPDSGTYNLVLKFLLKGRKLREAAAIFSEMVKNELWPNEENCSLALRMFLDTHDWEMGIKVWNCMVENGLPPLEESGNMLVSKLRDDRLPEACKYAEDMIDRGIKLSSSTLSKLKLSLQKIKKGEIHDRLLQKWKAR
jgi:pentatricopeptide repeat protein